MSLMSFKEFLEKKELDPSTPVDDAGEPATEPTEPTEDLDDTPSELDELQTNLLDLLKAKYAEGSDGDIESLTKLIVKFTNKLDKQFGDDADAEEVKAAGDSEPIDEPKGDNDKDTKPMKESIYSRFL